MPKNKIQNYVSGKGLLSIKVAPNQKVIEIRKVHPKGRILDIESNYKAMRQLSDSAYKLYMHFVLNVPGYKEALSYQRIKEYINISERSYYKSINELINNNYLYKKDNKDFKEYYLFLENPILLLPCEPI